MIEIQSETISRDAQLAMLVRHNRQAEIERAVDKMKLSVVPGRKPTGTAKWFRHQWFRSMMKDRKKRSETEYRDPAGPTSIRMNGHRRTRVVQWPED